MDRATARIAPAAVGTIGALIVIAGLLAVLRSGEVMSIPIHHLLHAGIALGAGMLAVVLANRLPTRRSERGVWAIVAVLAPIFGLALMWPSEYMYLMQHHWLHMLDHLGIAIFSWLAVYAAQAYAKGLGWPMVVLMVAMDASAAAGFGVSPPPSQLLSIPVASVISGNAGGAGVPPNAGAAATPAVAGAYHFDPAKGASLYAANCAGCHQPNGQGLPGVFPPLRGDPDVLNADPTRQIEAVLDGEHGQSVGGTAYSGMMPPFADSLTNEEIADIINHERSSWGNHSKQVTAGEVKALRKH